MKICYNCFHQSDSSTHYCENCGFPMDPDKQDICPDAIPCGTTLYGRYLIGRVLKQDSSSITYMAQDSRSKGTVAIREFFPKAWCVRTSMRTVSVPEENRDDFLEQKDQFLEEAEAISDSADSDQPPCIQSFFSQNDTAYVVVDYGSPENLQAYLSGMILQTGAGQPAGEPAHQQPVHQQPAHRQSSHQELSHQQPAHQQSSHQELSHQQPAHQQSLYQQPLNQQPLYQRPAGEKDPGTETGKDQPGAAAGYSFDRRPAAMAAITAEEAKKDAEQKAARAAKAVEEAKAAEEAKKAAAEKADADAKTAAWGMTAGAAEAGPHIMAGPDAKADPKLREAADGNSEKHPAFSPGRTNQPGSGKGSSNAFLPLAVILGILAFCLLILFLLLPRIMPDSGDMNRAIFTIRRQIDRKRRLFERSNPLEDWRTDRNQKDTQPDEPPQEKNENTNPFKEIFGVEKPEDLTDLFSGEQAEEGISSGNFYNKGFFGAYEGGILFGDSDGIYRFSEAGDAEGEKIANKHARYINKYGEKLYYLDEIVDKIVCLDPDSGSTYDVYSYESEAGYIPESLYIYDKWCYFSNGRRLYRFNLEDAGENSPVFPPQAELVLEDFNSTGHVFPSLCFVRGKLVYNGKEGITAADPDGSNPRVISDKEGHLISNGTNIYCWFGVHHIFRVSMDGRTEEILTTDSDETISAVNCLGDWIYYISTTDDSSSLWRMAEDGSTPELITGIGDEGDNVLSFCIFPDPFDSGVSAYAYLSLFDNQGDVPSQTFEIYALDD